MLGISRRRRRHDGIGVVSAQTHKSSPEPTDTSDNLVQSESNNSRLQRLKMDFSTFLAILLSLMPIIGPSRAVSTYLKPARHML
ncbi:hypothetical protein HZ326_27685 [Fusarium oxysporum f. sp. albedinis]|nr:hypothetical protein HZ326_27685 [Fusarium oxysporum f. sp. albedinis]